MSSEKEVKQYDMTNYKQAQRSDFLTLTSPLNLQPSPRMVMVVDNVGALESINSILVQPLWEVSP